MQHRDAHDGFIVIALIQGVLYLLAVALTWRGGFPRRVFVGVLAVAALRAPGDRVVLGPASDGGYYLIGLKYPHMRLFEDIAWSTERVLQQTVERAASLDLTVVTLPTWYDVDDAASLGWLCEEVVAGRSAAEFIAAGYPAPRTAAYLRWLVALRGADGLGIDGFAGERASR